MRRRIRSMALMCISFGWTRPVKRALSPQSPATGRVRPSMPLRQTSFLTADW